MALFSQDMFQDFAVAAFVFVKVSHHNDGCFMYVFYIFGNKNCLFLAVILDDSDFHCPSPGPGRNIMKTWGFSHPKFVHTFRRIERIA